MLEIEGEHIALTVVIGLPIAQPDREAVGVAVDWQIVHSHLKDAFRCLRLPKTLVMKPAVGSVHRSSKL